MIDLPSSKYGITLFSDLKIGGPLNVGRPWL